ncbi:MAG: hypothetical protein EOO04_07855 [Chitinophagaceae bacterium]|nr:MAG: hypothetical protein EOO04_07855 [Chitinophagaceae bacterium]
MKSGTGCLLLSLVVSVSCFAQHNTTVVGLKNCEFVDHARSNWLGTGPRPLRSVIWYPASNKDHARAGVSAGQSSSPAAPIANAGLSTDRKKYPLIIISHGSQGNAMSMQWLGHFLASNGFIAVAVSHNGTDEEEMRKNGLTLSDFCMWERPKDISVVLDTLFKDPVFAAKIDTGRIAVAGFSLGGTTAIWVAGAVFDMNRLTKSDPNIPERYRDDVNRFTAFVQTNPIGIGSVKHRAASFKDYRIKAVFALAPAIGQGFDKDGLRDVDVPVQIVVGDADIVNPLAGNAKHYTENIATARPLIILPGERGHYIKPSAPQVRAAELQEVAKLAVDFFKEVL